VARKGEEIKVCRVLVGKPEGIGSLGRPRRRWNDGLIMDLRAVGRGRLWSRFNWLRIGTVAGCCDCSDELSGSSAMELVIIRIMLAVVITCYDNT
jgi:hypothetical protein